MVSPVFALMVAEFPVTVAAQLPLRRSCRLSPRSPVKLTVALPPLNDALHEKLPSPGVGVGVGVGVVAMDPVGKIAWRPMLLTPPKRAPS